MEKRYLRLKTFKLALNGEVRNGGKSWFGSTIGLKMKKNWG